MLAAVDWLVIGVFTVAAVLVAIFYQWVTR